MNCFKKYDFYIDMKPVQVIGRIKSRTLFSNRLTGFNDKYKGVFSKNFFKIQFLLPGNILVHNSYNPIFYGEIEEFGVKSHLSIKMRPNVGGIFMFLIPLFLWLASLICFALNVAELDAIIATSIILLGLSICLYGMSNTKLNDMLNSIEELFCEELILQNTRDGSVS